MLLYQFIWNLLGSFSHKANFLKAITFGSIILRGRYYIYLYPNTDDGLVNLGKGSPARI